MLPFQPPDWRLGHAALNRIMAGEQPIGTTRNRKDTMTTTTREHTLIDWAGVVPEPEVTVEDDGGLHRFTTVEVREGIIGATAGHPAPGEPVTTTLRFGTHELRRFCESVLSQLPGKQDAERGYQWPLAIEVRVGSNMDREWPVLYDFTSDDPEWRRQIADTVQRWAAGEFDESRVEVFICECGTGTTELEAHAPDCPFRTGKASLTSLSTGTE